MAYGIGVVCGSGIGADGTPQTHTVSRLVKLKELWESGVIRRGICCGRHEAKSMANYCVAKLGIPHDVLFLEDRSRSTAGNLQYSKQLVQSWVQGREVPGDPSLDLVTNQWHSYRVDFLARWIVPPYPYKVHGTVDGRDDLQVEADVAKERWKLKVDRLASKLPVVSTASPEWAKILAYGLYGWPLLVKRLGNRH